MLTISDMGNRVNLGARGATLVLLITCSLAGCAPVSSTLSGPSQLPAGKRPSSVEDLIVVDCLIPGEIRQLGASVVYQTPRRTTKATVHDCILYGGEFVLRSTREQALEKWLPEAEKGNAEAQNNVGEIYEKGLGRSPDYTQAAAWYRKAADQGFPRAQTNLGFLYEKGLGVPQDTQEASRRYRQATGLAPGASMPNADLDRLRAQLTEQQSEAERLRETLTQTQAQLNEARLELARLKGEARTRREKDIERMAAQVEQSTAEIKRLHERIAQSTRAEAKELRPTQRLPDIDTGPYHALIIANSDYANYNRLDTTLNDATRVAQVLKDKYKFRTVKLLRNANHDDILFALDDFRRELTDQDNFLLYYSGHGEIDTRNRIGYWLPVDAAAQPSRAHWLRNEDLFNQLDIIPAKSMLVIADSCFSGSMIGVDNPPPLSATLSPEERQKLIEIIAQKRSRTALTSGDTVPVLAQAGAKHSVFAEAFLHALEDTREITEVQRIFVKIRERVALAVDALGAPPQIPKYSTFKGHEGIDFFFKPTAGVAVRPGFELRPVVSSERTKAPIDD